MAQDEGTKGAGFVEQTLMLPSRVWNLVEDLARTSDKEPSEVVADAVRFLVSGGGSTAAPASIAGPVSSSAPAGADTAAPSSTIAALGGGAIAPKLAAVHGEELGSAVLHEVLAEVMTIVEQKDHFIKQHSKEVASFATRIAKALDMEPEQTLIVETAALMHDIGKSRIPEEILGKKGRLTQGEWEFVKQYPEFSAEIVGEFLHLAEVVPAVRHHQERWDGTGYPDGLRGDEIPLGAQIVGLCDVYDVLTSDRAYRPALPPDIARRTIESGVGRLWNAEIAELLMGIVDGD